METVLVMVQPRPKLQLSIVNHILEIGIRTEQTKGASGV